MSVAVITSIYGGYDLPDPVPEQSVRADWILVTDSHIDVPGWRVVVEPRPHTHPRLAAKVAKCLPNRYTDADTVVWIDGSFRMLSQTTLEQIIDGSKGAPFAQIRHPWRDCIYNEAEASIGMPKYDGQNITAQVEHYRQNGYPENFGLYATGLSVRNKTKNNNWAEELGYRWLMEQVVWTYQDQLSQMPIVRDMRREGNEIRIESLPFQLHGSGLFEWHSHQDGT